GTTPGPTPTGQVCGYRPRPNGNTPLEEGWTRRSSPGGTNWNRVANTAATSGRAIFPPTTWAPTVTWGRPPPTPSHPTVTACTTPRATCGNGARTGGAPIGTSRSVPPPG